MDLTGCNKNDKLEPQIGRVSLTADMTFYYDLSFHNLNMSRFMGLLDINLS